MPGFPSIDDSEGDAGMDGVREEFRETLKPCPFCGWAVTIDEGLCHALHNEDNPSEVIGPSGVCCPNCAANVCGGMDDDEAIDAWNRRAES